MVVTLVLVSSKTLAPMVIVNNTKLVSTIQNWIDIIDKSLILARIAVTVLYTHTIHNLRDTEAEMQETEEQQMEVNDQRILEIDQRLDTLARVDVAEVSQMVQELAGSVHTLSKQYTELSARYTELYTQVSKVCTQLSEVVDKVHKPVDMTVYTQRLDALESMVKISVTEVKQNILQITQNNLYTQLPTRIHEVVDTSTEDVDEGTPCLPEYVPTTDKHAVIPVLEVPGVSENKVREVLTAFLNGTSWRDIPGNYSRTIKPIREAYDAYMSTQVHEGVYTYTNA
jgi:uncharacterized protein YoxC